MKRLFLQSVATSGLLLVALVGHASSRPHYGGTVQILLRDRVGTIDPVAEEDHPAARDRLAGLVFETLTTVDEQEQGQGHLHPGLAISWSSDSSKRVWQFHLRLAKFHDGTQVTAADVVASLTRAAAPWRCVASDRQTVTIDANFPAPSLAEMLALSRFAIVKRLPDGTLLGTGSFMLSEWRAGEHARFAVNEDHWSGRAYPDAIEVQMGDSLRERLLERQLGPYAAAELPLEQQRTLEQANQTILVSRPADLLVILFLQADSASPAKPGRRPVDPRLREALANSLDRVAISNGLLQRKGSPASGLLPQWLTGYEFLLPTPSDRARARKLADAAMGKPATAISLAYDFSDPMAKLVAERISVDAGQGGIVVQSYGDAHLNSKSGQSSMAADAVLLRLPLRSVDPSVALTSRAADLGLDSGNMASLFSAGRPEDLFEIERKMLEDFRAIPVAHVPQLLWLNGNAHNWLQLPTGAWQLDELWVEGAQQSVP